MANFRYYRLQITKIRSTAWATHSELGEFDLVNGTTRLTGMTVTAPGALTESWNTAELPAAAADNNLTTKWTNNNGTTGYLLYDFGTAVTATGYRLGTAPNAYGVADADPVSWYVDGSNDATTWTRLDARTDYPTPEARSTYLTAFTFSEGAPAAPAFGLAVGGNALTGMAVGATGVTGAAFGSRILFGASPGSGEPTTATTVAITSSSRAANNLSATIAWDTTAGNDGVNVTGVRVGRNGIDSNQTGPWSTDSTPDGTITFGNLRAADTYTFSVQMLRDGSILHGEAKTVTLAPSGGTAPTTTTLTATRTGGLGQAAITWSVTQGTDGLPVTGVRVGRDGSDSTGTGPWTIDVATAGTQTFFNLNAGSYNLTAQLLVNNVPYGAINTGAVTVSGPATPPSNLDSASEKWAKVTMPARGWFSGGSNPYQDDPHLVKFGQWRGDPADFLAHWIDPPDGAGWDWGGVVSPGNNDTATGWTGMLDLAIGGPTDYAAAANGSLDNKLRGALQNLRTNRHVGGVLRPTIVRPCHELNGTWYKWSVYPGMEDVFKRTMRRWRAIQQEVFPEAFWAMSLNGDQNSGVRIDQIWEDGVWDLYGADLYNDWPYIGTSASGIFTSWESTWKADRGTGKPRGAEAHRLFAEARGVPFYIPEFANSGGLTGDQHGNDPYWVNHMYDWINTNAGSHAGGFVADGWFNIAPGQYQDKFWIYLPSTGQLNPSHPAVAAAYRDKFPLS